MLIHKFLLITKQNIKMSLNVTGTAILTAAKMYEWNSKCLNTSKHKAVY